LTRQQSRFPEESQARSLVARAAKRVEKNVKTDEQGEILVADHQTFVMTAPGPGSEGPALRQRERFFMYRFELKEWLISGFPAPLYANPQTEAFCRMLDIPNKFNPLPAVTPSSS